MLGIYIQLALISLIIYIGPSLFKHVYSSLNNEIVWRKLRDKWVLVTNATTEVGVALCKNLASRGCSIIITGTNKMKLAALRKELETHTRVVSYVIDYSTDKDFSYLDAYDIGLVINKLGFYEAEPSQFIDKDLDYFLDHNIRGPLILLKSVIDGFIGRNFGYVVNIGFHYSNKPRPFYTMNSSAKALLHSWSESMYYEVRGCRVNVEYMETGTIALGGMQVGWLAPSPDTFAKSVFSMFGNSYFTIPYFPHFLEFLVLSFIPKFIAARYRKCRLSSFVKKAENLY